MDELEELTNQKIELTRLRNEVKDLLALKFEVTKIKDEISDLLIQKTEIVKGINEPIYKAKAEAEKIVAGAKSEAEITISAANKILAEAGQKHTQATELLHTAKSGIEELKTGQAKLAQDKVDLDGLRFAHENIVRQQRDSNSQITAQNRADAESVQQQLISIKQREDSMTRREISTKAAESRLNEVQATLEAKSAELGALTAELEALRKDLTKKEADIAEREKTLEGSLSRQIEIFDNSKAEVEDLQRQINEKTPIIISD